MCRLFGAFLLGLAIATPACVAQAASDDQKVVVVMLDGVRWQEVFRGAEPLLAANGEYMTSEWAKRAREDFVDVKDRPRALTPFMHGTMATSGVVIGNRDGGTCAQVANSFWFSYPGYNEVLTGKADPRIDSNAYGPNPNVTFLEWLNRQQTFTGKVRAYGSWNAFDHIVNEERSGVPVNSGFDKEGGKDPEIVMLDRLQDATAHLWKSERWDSITLEYALHGMRKYRPRAVFISFGETDEFAHMGDYAQYLIGIHRGDAFVARIWELLQADPFYRDKTTLIVTTDHGRGDTRKDRPDMSWRQHSSPSALARDTASYKALFPQGIPDSNQTWIAIMGPRIQAGAGNSYTRDSCAHNDQIAATALTALGFDWKAFSAEAGAPLQVFAAPVAIEAE